MVEKIENVSSQQETERYGVWCLTTHGMYLIFSLKNHTFGKNYLYGSISDNFY